jgi:peptidoglycan hydrolase CwlO-like protein
MKMDKKFIPLILVVLLVFSAVLNMVLLAANRSISEELASSNEIMNSKLKKAILANKEEVRQNIEEKYEADMVSYEALGKRADMLRAEVVSLKEQIKEQQEEIDSLKNQIKKKRR